MYGITQKKEDHLTVKSYDRLLPVLWWTVSKMSQLTKLITGSDAISEFVLLPVFFLIIEKCVDPEKFDSKR